MSYIFSNPGLDVPKLSHAEFFKNLQGESLIIQNRFGGFLPNKGSITWSAPTKHLDFPGNHFDRVFLVHSFEELSFVERIVLVKEALRVLRPGGMVLALSRAYGDGKDLYEGLSPYTDVEALKRRILNEADAVSLGADSICYVEHSKFFQDRKTFIGYLKEVYGLEVSLEHLWRFTLPVEVTKFDMGLTWQRK